MGSNGSRPRTTAVLNTIEGVSLSPEQNKALEKVMNSILVDGIASENEENCSDYAESIIKAKKSKKKCEPGLDSSYFKPAGAVVQQSWSGPLRLSKKNSPYQL